MRNSNHEIYLTRLFDATQKPVSLDELSANVVNTPNRRQRKQQSVAVERRLIGQRKPVFGFIKTWR